MRTWRIWYARCQNGVNTGLTVWDEWCARIHSIQTLQIAHVGFARRRREMR